MGLEKRERKKLFYFSIVMILLFHLHWMGGQDIAYYNLQNVSQGTSTLSATLNRTRITSIRYWMGGQGIAHNNLQTINQRPSRLPTINRSRTNYISKWIWKRRYDFRNSLHLTGSIKLLLRKRWIVFRKSQEISSRSLLRKTIGGIIHHKPDLHHK